MQNCGRRKKKKLSKNADVKNCHFLKNEKKKQGGKEIEVLAERLCELKKVIGHRFVQWIRKFQLKRGKNEVISLL